MFEQTAVNDMKYVIECSQYLPFTRKGVLLLNGDRTVKIGGIIRYKPTGEIFFVDRVEQSFSITDNSLDRITTVTVSRGLVEQLIFGINYLSETGVLKLVSYFNIINTKLKQEYQEIEETVYEKVPVIARKSLSDIIKPQNGFGEYMMHQQGARGARQIAEAVRTGSDNVSPDVRKNMFNNVGELYTGARTPQGFYNYWVHRYNRAYELANTHTSQYEKIYQAIAKEVGVPVEALRAFAQIESGNKNVVRTDSTYQGIFQIGQKEASNFGLNRFDERENTKLAALIYKRNTSSNPFRNLTSNLPQQDYDIVKKKNKRTAINREVIFSNFKVDQFAFNFFIKKLQFDPQYRTVTNRNAYNPDGIVQ
jgi:hypothetical protein